MPNASPTRSCALEIPRQRPVLRGTCKMVTACSTRSNKQGRSARRRSSTRARALLAVAVRYSRGASGKRTWRHHSRGAEAGTRVKSPKARGHPKCLCERQLFRARRIANIGVVFHHDRSRFNHRSNCSRIGSRREGCDGGRADAPCPCFTGELILPCLEACRRVAALCGARFAGYAHERHHCNDGGCLKSLASIHPLLIGAGKSLNTVRSHVPSIATEDGQTKASPVHFILTGKCSTRCVAVPAHPLEVVNARRCIQPHDHIGLTVFSGFYFG